jgi:hypothetical protein
LLGRELSHGCPIADWCAIRCEAHPPRMLF